MPKKILTIAGTQVSQLWFYFIDILCFNEQKFIFIIIDHKTQTFFMRVHMWSLQDLCKFKQCTHTSNIVPLWVHTTFDWKTWDIHTAFFYLKKKGRKGNFLENEIVHVFFRNLGLLFKMRFSLSLVSLVMYSGPSGNLLQKQWHCFSEIIFFYQIRWNMMLVLFTTFREEFASM